MPLYFRGERAEIYEYATERAISYKDIKIELSDSKQHLVLRGKYRRAWCEVDYGVRHIIKPPIAIYH